MISRPDISTTQLALVYCGSTTCRTLMLSLVPLQAFEMLGSAQAVSTLYFYASILGVTASLMIPTLVRRIRAKGVLTTGLIAMAISAPLLTSHQVTIFLMGMAIHLIGFAAIEVSLTLFLLTIVPAKQISFFEPKRVIFQASTYMIGPWLGVFLANQVWFYLPYILVVISAMITLWLMRHFGFFLVIEKQKQQTTGNFLNNIFRFASQPRLRLAWAMTLGRSVWWVVFFIYTPIYAVTYGLGETVGAALVSCGVAIVLTVKLWGAVGRKIGLRRMISGAFLAGGILMLVIGVFVDSPWIVAALLLLTAAVVTPLDAAGNIPFLRAVRSHERAEMTSVFSTYRDTSQLVPPGVFSVLLRYFEFPVVFFTIGISMLCLSGLARYLPRRL